MNDAISGWLFKRCPFKKHAFEILVLVLVGSLMFINLSSNYLWYDEAETAVIAENTLKFGIPKVYDGRDLLSTGVQDYFNSDYVITWSTWLQYYIEAFSFSVFGISTLSARILFTIIGFLAMFPIIALYRRFSLNKPHYYITMITTVFFVPYYLYSRQARYFPLLIFFMPLLLTSAYDLFKGSSDGRKKGAYIFVIISISLIILFHSNYLAAILMGFSIGCYALYAYFRQRIGIKAIKNTIISFLVVVIAALPWVMYVGIRTSMEGTTIISLVWAKTEFVFQQLNFSLPFLWLAISLACMIFIIPQLRKVEKSRINMMLYFGLFPILLLFISPQPNIRYIIGLFPIWILIITFIPAVLLGNRSLWVRAAAIVLFMILALTSVFSLALYQPFFYFGEPLSETCNKMAAEKSNLCDGFINNNLLFRFNLQSPIYDYIGNILSPKRGPVEVVVDKMNNLVSEDSTIATDYYLSSLLFYTPARVSYYGAGEKTPQAEDIIIVNLPERMEVPVLRMFVEYARQNNYGLVQLETPETGWDSRPDFVKYFRPAHYSLDIYKKPDNKKE